MATCFSEMSSDFQQTTQPYIQEDGHFRNHRCENFKFYIILLLYRIGSSFSVEHVTYSYVKFLKLFL
jgi:hypothetical protein